MLWNFKNTSRVITSLSQFYLIRFSFKLLIVWPLELMGLPTLESIQVLIVDPFHIEHLSLPTVSSYYFIRYCVHFAFPCIFLESFNLGIINLFFVSLSPYRCCGFSSFFASATFWTHLYQPHTGERVTRLCGAGSMGGKKSGQPT